MASTDPALDYYEVLQISPNADPEMVHRVYRLLAQRYHPDNAETGSPVRFRQLLEAYEVIGNPEQRARYDVQHAQRRKDRWQFVSAGGRLKNDFELEQRARLTVLEVLYTQRRCEPARVGLNPVDLEQLLGHSREHLEFTVWYLVSKKYVTRSDNSLLAITVEGAEYFEQNHLSNSQRLLPPSNGNDVSSEGDDR